MKPLLLIVLCLFPAFAFAFGGDWVSSVLSSHGPRAGLLNPALLAYPAPTRVAIELPGVGALASNNSFSVRYWNSHVAGDGFWDRNETRDILKHIPSDGLVAQAEVSVPAVGVEYRNFAFNARVIGGVRAGLPRVVAQMALIGTQLNERYSLNDLVGESMAAQDYSLAYGRIVPQPYLPSLAVGLTLHYYSGIAFTDSRNSSASFYTSDELIQGSGVFQSEMGLNGHGYGADLGFAATVSPKWKAGLFIQGMGATMRWKVDQTVVTSFEADAAGIDLDSVSESGYTDRLVEHSDTTIKGGGHVTLNLPTTISATAIYAARPDLNVAALLGIATRRTAFGPSGVQAGVAGEYCWNHWLVGQTGILIGGAHGSLFSLGTGLRFHHYELDATIVSTGGLGTYARGEGLWLSQRLFL